MYIGKDMKELNKRDKDTIGFFLFMDNAGHKSKINWLLEIIFQSFQKYL